MRDALRRVMEQYRLDVLVLPYRTAQPDDITKPLPGSWRNFEVRNHIASSTGFPTMIVPGGFFPSDGMPFGVQFLGLPFSEPTMIKLASGYEAATHHRRPAPRTPALPGEAFDY
jgi:Asp-tRNA(Asn)/Glu-tRNA(Gln) amidotransferase A subunit family amidase